ncbi:hypothetical protein PFTANZ_06411 [Plasmodium falciparum Tanzania (2000708)]|uniref:Erythrocyte membrane protein 1, PfEMP1 n=1 Tax=Plasmodium falciparum Tanzania (2000708) TaxID=1036725 RepID=A0A024VY93_PLAFA|nr:hypothetical protein PFTANZ_06411 [Plasmodium falciparum Tanzania (2000708)]
MAAGGGGSSGDAEKYKSAPDAKHLLDMIGQTVHSKVHREDANYRGKLYGRLTQAKFSNSDTVPTENPCNLDYNVHTNVTSTVINPCADRSDVRFSDVHGGQCTRNRIKDSKSDIVGACAPFRRLHICDKNIQQIKTGNITTHNLLVDVCMAAQFEGVSISGRYPQYVAKYKDYGSTMCTMLARSFADIGDIIRGKDLYLGNPEEIKQRQQLEDKLKEIFAKIHSEVTNGRNVDTLKTRYGGDPNYYKLREDWWDANRAKVWYAITCDAKGFDYFRQTACNGGKSSTPNKCRCGNDQSGRDKSKPGKAGDVNIVPTYFDYVPQYLRWFEEWAEDFCRKRKHKLKDIIEKCRGKNGKDKYCSRNGYDCTKTIYKKGRIVVGYECTSCSVLCRMYEKWIDNQKKEFLKQKRKYAEEIQKKDQTKTTITIGNTTINNLYVKEFYQQLQSGYKDVNAFLGLLNQETTCKDPPQVGTEKASNVDFTEDNFEKTFDHKEYCDTCPWCAKKIKNEQGKWEDRQDTACASAPTISFDESKTTVINLLTPDKETSGILEKYKTFCQSPEKKKTENWKCHFESSDKNYCVLHNEKANTKDETIMSYESFFWGWIDEMLEDSIKWRTEHSSCINNKEATKCIGGCKKACECFQKWVVQKEKEWKEIEKHFDKQKDMGTLTHYEVLQYYLSEFFKEKIKQAYGEEKCNELMDAFSNNKKSKEIKDTEHSNDPIKILLKHEEDEARNCVTNNPHEKCPSIDPASLARSATSPNGPPPVIPRNVFEDEKHKEPEFKEHQDEGANDEDEVEEAEGSEVKENPEQGEEEKTESKEERTKKEGEDPVSPPTTEKSVDVCNTVHNILTGKDNLKEACGLKYGPGGKENFPNWKCIPSGDEKATISEGSDAKGRQRRNASDDPATVKSGSDSGSGAPSGKDTGSVCIPPRRRKLYVGKLTQWAKKHNTEAAQPRPGESQTQSPVAVSQSSSTDNGVSTETSQTSLLHAFIESAAIETFFLWHKYKEQWRLQKAAEQEQSGLPGVSGVPGAGPPQQPGSVSDGDPQTQLQQTGNIPPDFLRLMFYTLADYKDILYSGSNTSDSKGTPSSSSNDNLKNIVVLASGSTEEGKKDMEKIQKKIQEHINNGSKPSGQTPDKWWQKNGKDIWKGMICALTYDTDSGEKGTPQVDEKVKEAFFGTANIKPANPGNKNGTYKTKYQYSSVKLDENSGTGVPQNTSPTSAPSDTPTLDSFIKRPPYFRYLEEWGETFCRERAKRLAQIKHECKVEENGGKKQNPKCSCYGEHCEHQLEKKPTIVRDFLCSTCARHCGLYKRWIERKKIEFTKQSGAYDEQKKAYNEQKQKCQKESGKAESDNGFCVTGGTCNEAKDFLGKLGSCKNNDNESGQGKKGRDKLDFSENGETFKHTKHCDPCSEFKVKCKQNLCNNDEGTDCQNKDSITADDIEKSSNSTQDVTMSVSDNNPNGFHDLNECEKADIFNGIKKEQWKCRNVCGYVVCKPKNGNGKNDGEKHIITITALVTHWVQNFLEDYNKINDKISHCMNSGEVRTCQNKCKDKCTCVKAWITKKRAEWKTIRDRFNEQYNDDDTEMKSLVKIFFEELIPKIAATIDKGNHNGLVKLVKSVKCNCGNNSQNGKEGEDNDLVKCLLDKLEKLGEKATSCQDQASGETEKSCADEPPLEDEEEEDYENENTEEAKKKMMPKICEKVVSQEPETDDKCGKPEPAPSKESAAPSGGSNTEQTSPLKPEEEAPAPDCFYF